jgi:hypothetical protein
VRNVLPNTKQIKELVQFLPLLYRKGFEPIKKWGGGNEKDGKLIMPWPEYEEEVESFLRVASQEHWCDYDYSPQETQQMLDDSHYMSAPVIGKL